MAWKQVLTDYFSFSRRDRIGNLVLAALIVVLFFIPGYINGKHRAYKEGKTDTAWVSAARKLELDSPGTSLSTPSWNEQDNDARYNTTSNYHQSDAKTELFIFDPNTLDKNGWRKLGLREKTISTILNYRSKGGRFRKPDDLLNIYGLKENEFEKLEPYIRIQEQPAINTSPPVREKNSLVSAIRYVNINTADTSAFIALPGIGSKLAARIVSFRNKLGGFYSIDQVKETFGIQDSVFQKIRPYLQTGNIELRKININTATIEELKSHPYIRYAIANTIISYRNEHGPFLNIEDLKKIMVITDEIFEKMAHYLTTGN